MEPAKKKTPAKTGARKRTVSAKSYLSSSKPTEAAPAKTKAKAVKKVSTASRLPSEKPKTRTSAKKSANSTTIQQKAYELFEMRGCVPGHPLFDWTLAETLITLESKKNKPLKLNADEMQDKIRIKANDLCHRRGSTPGFDLFDWFIAESLVQSGEE